MNKTRCDWVKLSNPKYLDYHDNEWGVPVHDDQLLFEFLILESFQAGLSWEIVLNKRENFRNAFSGFDVEKVARFNQNGIEQLQRDSSIIRNKLKIEAAINNAKQFLKIQQEFGSFDSYIWNFVDGKPLVNRWEKLEQIPANTKLSDTISKNLKQRGFKFMGTTVVYSHMQATGMVNDHLVNCFRYLEIQQQTA
ncbi:DNA-3-methyladenine glycosylase I [bacterium]|nr:DNA-3-methyladenine glycosylase I [bacterium]